MATGINPEISTVYDDDLENLANTVAQQITSKVNQPRAADVVRAKQALNTLNNTLLGEAYSSLIPAALETFISTLQGVTLVNTPIGSYALNLWDPSEPVLCSIAGTPSEKTFFSLARAKFRKSETASIAILKANKNDVNMFQLVIDNLRFMLQYRQLPVWLKSEVSNVLFSGSDANRDSVAKEKDMAYRDTAYLKDRMHHETVLHASYFSIKSWALSHGIFSPRFKYFGELDLIILVANACQNVVALHTAETVVAQFLTSFAVLQFENEVMLHGNSRDQVHRNNPASDTKPVDHRPRVKFTKSMTKETFCIVKDVIDRTQRMFLHSPPPIFSLSMFASRYTSYVQISLSYWGLSLIKGGRFVDMVDTTVADWIDSSNRVHPYPGLYVWPTRVKDCRKDASDKSYEAFYIAGIDSQSKTTLPDHTQHLTDLLSQLLSTIRSSSQYDPTMSFFDAQIISDLLTVHLIPDTKNWGLILEEVTPDDSSDEEETLNEETDFWGLSKQKCPLKAKASHKKLVESPSSKSTESSQPLRPALDILNRIRYDSNYDAEDYLIGYLDRHSGMKEMSVPWWKGEDNTEEDFIPQSRIKYYKRKSDGTVVWDRHRKLDLVFGSGLPGGTLSSREY